MLLHHLYKNLLSSCGLEKNQCFNATYEMWTKENKIGSHYVGILLNTIWSYKRPNSVIYGFAKYDFLKCIEQRNVHTVAATQSCVV